MASAMMIELMANVRRMNWRWVSLMIAASANWLVSRHAISASRRQTTSSTMKLMTNARVLPALSSHLRNWHMMAVPSNASHSTKKDVFDSSIRNIPCGTWAASVSAMATSSATSRTMNSVPAAQKSGR